MQRRQQYLDVFVLIYLILGVVLFTLNPFVFQPFTPAEFWVWRFSVEDFSRNVLLFLPFGIVLKYSFCKRCFSVLVCGFLLSLFVEVGQLFIEARTSNVVDLISNSSGALLGSLFCTWTFARQPKGDLSVLLACAFVPLCWVSAMRSLWELPAVLTVWVSVIASLSLIQSQINSQPKRAITASFWTAISILPVLNTRPIAGLVLVIAMPFVIIATSRLSLKKLYRITISCALLALILILLINGWWYFTEPATIWTNNQHLRVSEIGLMIGILVMILAWQNNLVKPLPKTTN